MPKIDFKLDLTGSIAISDAEMQKFFKWDSTTRRAQLWIVTDSDTPPVVSLAGDNNDQGVITSIEAFGSSSIPGGLLGIVFNLRASNEPKKGVSINVWQRGGRKLDPLLPTQILKSLIIIDDDASESQKTGQTYA